MDSEYDDVQNFMKQKLGKDTTKNRQLADKTKWRWKEKQKIKKKIIEKAIEKSVNKKAKAVSITFDRLSQAKDYTVAKLVKKIKENPDLDISELDKAIQAIRREMCLPNTYTKNENVNENKEILSQEDMNLLDNYFKNKKWAKNQ